MADEIVYKINLDTNEMESSLVSINTEINDLTQSTKELNAEQKKLEADGKKNTQQYDENNKKLVENKENMKVLKKEYNDQSKVLQTSNKLKKEETGHLEKLKAELALTTNSINKMSSAQLKDNNIGVAAIKKQKSLRDEIAKTEEEGGNYFRSVGNYAKATEGMGIASDLAGKSMSGFGGTIGKLPGLFKGAIGMAKTFFTVLLTNPVGLILTVIGALVGVVVAVLSKFQPLLDWISDKLSYLGGMVDGFVESMKGIGDVISAVFSGDFEKASDLISDMGDKMLKTAEAAEALNEALRNYERQAKYNAATTAEVEASQNRLRALYKDESKSIEERTDAFNKYYKEQKAQADADYNAFKDVYDKRKKKYEDNKGVALNTADQIKSAMDKNLLTEEEYNELMDSRIELTELSGKVAEVETRKVKEFNTIRNQKLTQELNLLKARTAYYEASNQSILDGEKTLTEEMLKEEETRLKKIESKKIAAAKKELDIIKSSFDLTSNQVKEAELKFATEVINIKKSTNDEILANQEDFGKQQLTQLNEQFNLFKQMEVTALKDSTIETKEELKERLLVHEEFKNKRLELVRVTAEKEGWSATKTKTELLKVEQEYTDTVEKLNKSLADNLAKTKKDATKLLEDIEKDFLDSRILDIDETYAEEKRLNKKKLDDNNAALKKAYDKDLISLEQYNLAKKEAKETFDSEEAETQATYDAAKLESFQGHLASLQAVSQAFQDFNNAQRDLELTKIKNKYDAEDKIANDAYKKKADKLKADLNNGIISQKKYDKQMNSLKETFDAEQKVLDDKRIAEENKAKKEAFEKNKKFQIASIVMNAASAIIGTWSGYADMGLPGTILAAIQTALIAGTAALQLSTVQQTQFQAAGGGILNGPLHAAGGINMGAVEAEGGEFIINRASTQAYEPILNSINQAGNRNGDQSNVSDIIDYDRLGSVLQSKKVYVVSHDISEQQDEDVKITDRTEF